MNPTRILAAGLSTLLLLQGCTFVTPAPPASSETPEPVVAPREQVTQAPERPFPIETFYALLVAEIAGSRERYDVALSNYMQQAETTRDPDIAARAARIARFLNARSAALKSALLWVEIDADDNEARFTAASELIQADRLQEAAQHSRHLLENHSATLYQSIAARAPRLTDTQRETLATEFQQRLSEHPENTDLLIGLALMNEAMGQPRLALENIRQALGLDETLVAAAVLEANLLSELGQPQRAIRKLSELLDTQPDNARLRLQYARLLASIDMDEAYQQFSILLEQKPGDEDLIFSLGLICYQRGMLEQATEHFGELTHSERHGSTAHYYMGRIAETGEQWQVALEHYLRVEPGPNFMASLVRTTEILVRAGQSSAASKRLSAARERFPEQSEQLFLLEAEVLNRHQQLNSALSLLDEALLHYPSSTDLLYSRAMINEQLDRLDLLETDLRALLSHDPNNAMALNALGYTLANRTDRYLEAQELIAQALQLKPDDPAILDSMGWVQFRMGNKEEALLLLRQAMEAMPDHEIAAHLGEVLWILGREKEARSVWVQGLKLNPGSRVISEVVKRLGIVEPIFVDEEEDDE